MSMDPKLGALIQQAFDDAFKAGEIEEIVVVPLQGGPVRTIHQRVVPPGLSLWQKVKWLVTGRS